MPALKESVSIRDFIFNLGDELLFIGHMGSLESGITDVPENSQTYTFQFASNIPCPETPTVKGIYTILSRFLVSVG